MNSTTLDQKLARECWAWLWAWLKKNEPAAYREKYVGAKLAGRIGCHPSAITLWKQGRLNFEEDKFGEVCGIMDEWCALLPQKGWVTPSSYRDANNVIHRTGYRPLSQDESSVLCDKQCGCGKRTPSVGTYCMHCGRKLWVALD